MTEAPNEKCIWCNQSGGELRTIELPAPNQFPHEGREPRLEEALVHPEHESRARDFVETAYREGGIFIGVMLFLPFLLFVPAAVAAALSIGGRGFEYWMTIFGGAVLILLGLFMMRFPFSTPTTTRFLGLKHSIWLVRMLAVAIAAQGIWLLTSGVS